MVRKNQTDLSQAAGSERSGCFGMPNVESWQKQEVRPLSRCKKSKRVSVQSGVQDAQARCEGHHMCGLVVIDGSRTFGPLLSSGFCGIPVAWSDGSTAEPE